MSENPSSGRRAPATVITSAEESYEEQFRARKKRYMIMMSTRIPMLLIGAACYQIPWLAILIIAASIPVPWLAVLMANDRPSRKKRPKVQRVGVINHERALPAAGHHEIVDETGQEPADR